MAEEKKVFHLGICMAGAITAGSYTAGAIDYLLETLERWQQQKAANQLAIAAGTPLPFPQAPMYDVVIDVVGGASAGGMCAAITSAMLVEGFTLDDLANKKSKMYKSWIELDDDGIPEGTIKKMLATDDITKDGIVSLLNSQVLTNISRKAVKILPQLNYPPYVSKKLETILTLANLRGTKYAINFKSYGNDKQHLMSLHRDFMHFKINDTANPQKDFLSMDFSDAADVKLFQESAVATGAFPVGLRPRALVRNADYYHYQANVTAGIDALTPAQKLNITVQKNSGNNYHSLNIDGGTFNNEPFGETERALTKMAGKAKGQDLEPNITNRTILMIDPFPSNSAEIDEDDLKPQLINVAPRIISALRAQSSFKTQDLIDALSDNNYLKYLITPSKNTPLEPLCCSTVGAFGGFLYKEFRLHDYELGRRNTQQFLRKHFVLPYNATNDNENNPIHQNLSSEAKNKHIVAEVDGSTFFPIIPDPGAKDDASTIPSPEFPKYPASKLKELEDLLDNRVKAILDNVEELAKEGGNESDSAAVKDWFKQSRVVKIFKSVGRFLVSPFLLIILRIIKKQVRKALVAGVIKWILTDLENAELLDNDTNN